MSLIAFLKSRVFWLNLLASVVIGFGMLFLIYRWLDNYTQHGQTVTVPDLRGKRLGEAEEFLKARNLKLMVADSSVYNLKMPPGSIIEQDPKPNGKVKEGRTIYITLTRTSAPEIQMPELTDVSLRQAEAILQSYGLKVGELIYKPDLAKNAVLAVKVRGVEIHAGDRVSKGTVIDLVLGDGFGNTQVLIPDLNNLTLEEALFVLKGSGLLAGQIEFDENVKDSSKAVIYMQFPEYADSVTVNQGQAIDLYLRAPKF